MNRLDTRLSQVKFKDLIFVILYGAVLPILVGFLIGFIDYYIQVTIKFSFAALFFFLSASYLGAQIRKQYMYPHIVYTIITGLFLVVEAIIVFSFPMIYAAALSVGQPSIIFNVGQYIYLLGYLFRMMLTNFRFDYIILVLVFVVGTYVGIKKTY